MTEIRGSWRGGRKYQDTHTFRIKLVCIEAESIGTVELLHRERIDTRF